MRYYQQVHTWKDRLIVVHSETKRVIRLVLGDMLPGVGCHGDGSHDTNASCTKGTWVEHIVHIDGVTGSSPVCDHQIGEALKTRASLSFLSEPSSTEKGFILDVNRVPHQ